MDQTQQLVDADQVIAMQEHRIAELLASVVTLRKALENATKLIKAEWFIEDCPLNESPRLGYEALVAALSNPGATEALERVRREAKIEVLESLKKQAEDLRAIIGNGSLRARLLALLVDELLELKAAALRGGQ